jgi:hypothetical protein
MPGWRAEPRTADRFVLAALGLAVTCVTTLGIAAHATYGARVAVDEPQYLLTAMSIGRDGSLDISDELAAEAYRPFHRVDLPRQTVPVGESAREVSPHDPLLPVLIAGPARVGGWVAAKAAIAVMAGALAVLTAWTAMRRFGVSRPVAIGVTVAFACAAPLATYATQIYPEVPAALAATSAVAAATAPLSRRSAAVLVVAVAALPWLAVKYAPVAAVLAGVALWRWRHQVDQQNRRWWRAVVLTLAVAGVAYLIVHRWLYGGWTSYARGGQFVANGELSAVGDAPDYTGRSRRLAGLLVDDGFGLAMWMPAWLLLPVAVGVLWRRRPPAAEVLLAPLATGWLVATFVALTMHGWWWPGRQLVVVLPLAVVAIAFAVETVPVWRLAFVLVAVLGMATWVWTTVEAITRRHVLVVDFERTANPWIQAWRRLLPDGRSPSTADGVMLAVWTVAIAALGWVGWRYAHTPSAGVVADPARSAARAATVSSRSGLRGAKPSSS